MRWLSMKLMEKYSNGNTPPFAADGTRHPLTWVVVADSENAFIYQTQKDHIELLALAKPENHGGARQFAREVAAWLDSAEQQQAFDNIILIAGPHTLGNLRAELPENVKDHIHAEVPKELTTLTAESLLAYFSRPVNFHQ